MERSKIARIVALTILCSLVITLFPIGNTYAEPAQQDQEKTIANDPFLPGNPIDSPFFQKYPPDKFIIDGVPADDDDFSTNLYEFTNDCLDTVFYGYMWLVEFGIRLVNWAFDMGIADQLISIVQEVIPLLKTTVWDKFWYLMFAAGFLGMVLLFGRGEDRNAFNVFVSMFTILCLAPVFFTFWPGFMKQVNEVVTYTSGKILSQMVEVPTVESNGNRSLAFKQPEDNNDLTRSPLDPNITWVHSEELNHMVEIRRSIHAVDDSLWKAFVYEPYLTINFGDRELGEKYFDALMSKGTNVDERREYLEKVGGIQDGKTDNEQFQIFTADGVKKRMKYLFSSTMLALLPLFTMAVFSFVVLFWTLFAIGLALLMVVHFLLSFWPGYGLSNTAHYLYRTIAALVMKVFYSIILAVFLRVWIAFNDPTKFPGLNLGGKVILLFLTLWAFWKAVIDLREKVTQVRGLFGGQSRLDAGFNELEFAKGKLATAGHVAMRRAQYQLAKRKLGKKNLSRARLQPKKPSNAPSTAKKVFERFGPKQAQLQSNLSQGARDVFTKMRQQTVKGEDGKTRKLNPMKASDRDLYAEMRPEYKAELHELGQWLDNPTNFQFHEVPDVEDGKILPPAPPKAGTPEYLIWKKNPELQKQWDLYTQVKRDLHDKAYLKYKKRLTKYENNLLLRMTTKRPRFDEFRPSKRKIAKEYRKRMEKGKESA